MNMLARIATVVCMIFIWTSAGWWFLLLYLCTVAPLAPVVADGQVIPINNHGTLHYITGFQNFCLHCQVIVTILVMVFTRWLMKRHPWPWLERFNFGK